MASEYDISQGASESYRHLSQDDTLDLSSIQDNTPSHNDLSMFIRMAQQIDKNKRASTEKKVLYATTTTSGSHEVRTTAEDLFRLIQPYLKSNFDEFKEVIEQLNQKNASTPVKNNPVNTSTPIYITPPKRYESSDDDLSLKQEKSPMTLPPHSREMEADISYIPKRKKESEELKELRKVINDLQKQSELLKQDNYVLKKKVETLEKRKEEPEVEQEEEKEEDIPHLDIISEEDYPTASRKDENNVLETANKAPINEAAARYSKSVHEVKVLKQDNQKLFNELIYYKQDNKFKQERIEELNKQIGDEYKLIGAGSLNPQYLKYYNRLQLEKIDALTKTEMNNIIKNIMLSLLIIKFDNLKSGIIKTGKYLQLTMDFLDKVHDKLYDNLKFKPSMYLKDEARDVGNLKVCLDDMLKVINVNIDYKISKNID